MWGNFKNPFRDEVAARPERREIPVSPEDAPGDAGLMPNDFYFEIRLCEMYMRKSAEAGRSFAPRALAITECLYGNNVELTLPIAVGQKILDQIATQTGEASDGKVISFTDCLLAGPMPYRGADIGFFAGLYRVEHGNWTDSAFDLVADLTSGFGVDVSKYIEIGRTLVGGLPSLLGVGSEDWRFGHFGPIYKESDAYFDRYLIMAAADDTPVDWQKLEVRNEVGHEALYFKPGNGGEPFTERDFALFRLRSRQSRGDYARFGFNARFVEAKRQLTEGQSERAEWTRLQMLQEISDCPDLTEPHKLSLVGLFNGKLGTWKAGIAGFHPGTAPVPSHRGAGGSAVAQNIGAAAATASQKGFPPETVKTLTNMSRGWERLSRSPAIAKDGDPSDNDIEAFLADAENRKIFLGTAADLVDALKLQTFVA